MLSLQTPETLIDEMKKRNIKFNKMTEDEALEFLKNNTYYKKISSYKSNFVCSKKDNLKIYFDLDFGYLKELSTIDMHLRKVILHICLNIEHSISTRIINLCQNKGYDGYEIVSEFLSRYPNVQENIIKNSTTSYCSELIEHHKNKFPIWVLLEIISFGDLCKLFLFLNEKDFFGDHTKYVQKDNVSVLYNVHNLRNAAAHNHCIIRDLTYKNNTKPLHVLSDFLSPIDTISTNQKHSTLKTKVFSDFLCMIYSIKEFIDSDGMRNGAISELKDLFNNRMLKNKDYFIKCNPISNGYNFIKKVLDFYF